MATLPKKDVTARPCSEGIIDVDMAKVHTKHLLVREQNSGDLIAGCSVCSRAPLCVEHFLLVLHGLGPWSLIDIDNKLPCTKDSLTTNYEFPATSNRFEQF